MNLIEQETRPRIKFTPPAIPSGYCQCGCGSKTKQVNKNRPDRHMVKGQFYQYVGDHKGIKYRPDLSDAAPFKIDGVYCRLIPLTQGQFTVVDDQDHERAAKFNWQAQYSKTMNSYYAKKEGDQLHRFILGLDKSKLKYVDHINHNTLDNRRINLRIATPSQNSFNRKTHATNKSGFKGVHWDKEARKWRASIRLYGKLINLGRFSTPELAHAAYCEAAIRLFGEYANPG